MTEKNKKKLFIFFLIMCLVWDPFDYLFDFIGFNPFDYLKQIITNFFNIFF